MNEFILPAQQIVRDIVEDEDDFDMKEVSEPSAEGYWVQIGGDVNGWVYGGSWFNPAKRHLIHFDGIDNPDQHEVDPDEIEVPETMLAKLPPEQPDWRDNTDRDRMIGNYQYAKAELINKKKKYPFWMMVDVPMDQLPPEWRKYDRECPTGIDAETWERMPIEVKMDELGSYFGFDGRAYSGSWNRYEAKKTLGNALR